MSRRKAITTPIEFDAIGCDWGDCEQPASGFRWDAEEGWLGVCDEHAFRPAPRQPGPAPTRFADLAAPVRADPDRRERIEAYRQELDDRQPGPAEPGRG